MALGTQHREVFRAFGAEARIGAMMGGERRRLIAGLTPVPGAAEGCAPGGGVPPARTLDVGCVVHGSLPCRTRTNLDRTRHAARRHAWSCPVQPCCAVALLLDVAVSPRASGCESCSPDGLRSLRGRPGRSWGARGPAIWSTSGTRACLESHIWDNYASGSRNTFGNSVV
jgi:hypothetical protein